ncbi:hypothetical protein CUD01_02630 [Cellulomonas uda]|uniref:Uncharacterized protein n=1 Tax=Cellulomonas uda TaxID=1714 RepID=A0A4Y3K5Q7_CELUD|nr:hypothetical protein CUD01_02630 [Cellulomonas uda]
MPSGSDGLFAGDIADKASPGDDVRRLARDARQGDPGRLPRRPARLRDPPL